MATKPPLIYIEQVENLYMDKFELATATSIYIKKVENLHMDRIESATTVTSYYEQPTDDLEPTTTPLTNSQLVLACYYVLISWGIQPRVNLDISHVARFMHLLTRKPYTRIYNSEFYKKLQQAPQLKSDKELIKDLELIKNLLVQLELKDASSLVGKQLTEARQKVNKRFK